MKAKTKWQIKNAEDAQHKANALKAVVSGDTILTLHTVIYLARQVEELNRLLGSKGLQKQRRWWQFWKRRA